MKYFALFIKIAFILLFFLFNIGAMIDFEVPTAAAGLGLINPDMLVVSMGISGFFLYGVWAFAKNLFKWTMGV